MLIKPSASFVLITTWSNLFKTAFPILNIDLKMSRQDAFDKSINLSAAMDIGPSEYNQAATFGTDYSTQTFIELDNGDIVVAGGGAFLDGGYGGNSNIKRLTFSN